MAMYGYTYSYNEFGEFFKVEGDEDLEHAFKGDEVVGPFDTFGEAKRDAIQKFTIDKVTAMAAIDEIKRSKKKDLK